MSSEQSVDADMAASDEHLEVSLEDLESCESPAFDYDAIFDERFSQALDVEKLFQGDMNESPEGLACGVYTSQAAQASQNPACLVYPSRADVCQSEVCQDKQDKLDNQPGGLQTHGWDLLSASSSSIGRDDVFWDLPIAPMSGGAPAANPTSQSPRLASSSYGVYTSRAVQESHESQEAAVDGDARRSSRSRSPRGRGAATLPVVGPFSRVVLPPRAISGIEHWQRPLFNAIQSARMRLPEKQGRRMMIECLCAGTGAEILGCQAILSFYF